MTPDLAGGGAQRQLCLLIETLHANEEVELRVLCGRREPGDEIQRLRLEKVGIRVVDQSIERGLLGVLKRTLQAAVLVRNFNPNIIQSFHYNFGLEHLLSFRLLCRAPYFGRRPNEIRYELRNLLWRAKFHAVSLFSTGIVAISRPLKMEMIEAGVPESKICVIENGLDLKRFRDTGNKSINRALLDIAEGQFLILVVARLVEGKGHFVALEAVKRITEELPSLKLCLVGEGPCDAALRREVLRLDLRDKVIFFGQVESPELYYGAADVCLMVSDHEGFGSVMLESMSVGCPVIATRTAGATSVIQNFDNGFLVPIGDVSAIVDAIRNLVAMGPDKERLIEAGKATSRKFGADLFKRNYLGLYKKQLAARQR